MSSRSSTWHTHSHHYIMSLAATSTNLLNISKICNSTCYLVQLIPELDHPFHKEILPNVCFPYHNCHNSKTSSYFLITCNLRKRDWQLPCCKNFSSGCRTWWGLPPSLLFFFFFSRLSTPSSISYLLLIGHVPWSLHQFHCSLHMLRQLNILLVVWDPKLNNIQGVVILVP